MNRTVLGGMIVVMLVVGGVWLGVEADRNQSNEKSLVLNALTCQSPSFDGLNETRMSVILVNKGVANVDISRVLARVSQNETVVLQSVVNLSAAKSSAHQSSLEDIGVGVLFKPRFDRDLDPFGEYRKSYNVSLVFQNMDNLTLSDSCEAGGLVAE